VLRSDIIRCEVYSRVCVPRCFLGKRWRSLPGHLPSVLPWNSVGVVQSLTWRLRRHLRTRRRLSFIGSSTPSWMQDVWSYKIFCVFAWMHPRQHIYPSFLPYCMSFISQNVILLCQGCTVSSAPLMSPRGLLVACIIFMKAWRLWFMFPIALWHSQFLEWDHEPIHLGWNVWKFFT
jgi:hypothetical protein